MQTLRVLVVSLAASVAEAAASCGGDGGCNAFDVVPDETLFIQSQLELNFDVDSAAEKSTAEDRIANLPAEKSTAKDIWKDDAPTNQEEANLPDEAKTDAAEALEKLKAENLTANQTDLAKRLTEGFKSIQVVITSAANLPKGFIDKPDPYVKVFSGKAAPRLKTRTIKNNLNPVWNQTFVEVDWDGKSDLELSVWDDDLSFDDFLGKCTLTASQVARGFAGTLCLTPACAPTLTFKIIPQQ